MEIISHPDFNVTPFLFLITGIVSGFLAGLLGIGGGILIVPALAFLFSSLPHPFHSAVATSLAAISVTSFASMRAHDRKGAVDWPTFRRIAPGILAGSLVAPLFSLAIPAELLKAGFAAFAWFVAFRLFRQAAPSPRPMPGSGILATAGVFIGALSALVGIGGGSLSVPFLAWRGLPLVRAIGTSAAIGFPISAAGTLAYSLSGLIQIPALLLLVSGSVLAVPAGAKLASKLPVPALRRLFAVLLFILGARMLASVTLPSLP